jgi:type IV secretory pathway VirJ component
MAAPASDLSTAQDSEGVAGLPVIEMPARPAPDSTLAVLLSGDGGWAAGDKAIARRLTEVGIPVVGLDIPSYLGVARTPDGTSADLARLLDHYLHIWHRRRVVVIGYSHGANLAPFMVSRLPDSLRQRIAMLAMVSLADHAAFRFHLADLVADVRHEGDYPVLPELEKLRGLPMLCVRASGDAHSLCPALAPALARVVTTAGGHRVHASEGREIGGLILTALGRPSP